MQTAGAGRPPEDLGAGERMVPASVRASGRASVKIENATPGRPLGAPLPLAGRDTFQCPLKARQPLLADTKNLPRGGQLTRRRRAVASERTAGAAARARSTHRQTTIRRQLLT